MKETVRSVCSHDCPDACGLLVEVEDGRVVAIKGDPAHPFTRGALCVKLNHYLERLYSPLRILHPLKRSGPRGSGRFETVSWDEAFSEIVRRYTDIIGRYGPEAILPASYAGTEGILGFNAGHAFFNRLGASRLNRNLCLAAANAGLAVSLGRMPTTDMESAAEADLVVIWGSNTLSTNIHAWPFFLQARRRGAKIVVIDPYRNATAAKADLHLPVKPGTDAALALGLMNVLISEDLIDHDFIKEHTVGFAELAERVKDYPPEKAASITGLEPEAITSLAREYGRAAYPFLRIGFGLSRQARGGMAVRTIALLPALTGTLHRKQGGLALTTSPAFELNEEAVIRDDLRPGPARTVALTRLGQALTGLDGPPVKALHVYQHNPAAVCPDSGRVLAGLRREDLFIVVQEMIMTETAQYADIILPSASSLEFTDLYTSYGHYCIQLARPAVKPLGESRPPLEIFQKLARRFGFTEDIFSATPEELIRLVLQSESPWLRGISFERLAPGLPVKLNVPENPFLQGFKTPSGKVEFYSLAMADQGLDPLPDGSPSLDTAHEGRYPLQLITPPRREYLNSTFNEINHLRQLAGPPSAKINPADASARDIESGQVVRVYNDRGDCFVYADITQDTRPGVVVIEGIFWSGFAPLGRGVNRVTSSDFTDLGQGAAFHTSLVEVEGY